MTAGAYGLKSRFSEWSRPLEPRCRKQDFGAVASCDDRMRVDLVRKRPGRAIGLRPLDTETATGVFLMRR
jgi:hypothetical protein